MSVVHCGMFEVQLVNNVCIAWSLFFFNQSWERTGCFPLSFPYTDSDWFPGLHFVECCGSCIPIASASLTAFIPSAEVITLVSRVMKFALSSQKGLPTYSNDYMALLITNKFLGCWIPSMIFVRARLGCQMFALGCQMFIQHADHFRPCKHPVPKGIVFLSNLLCLRHL